MPISQKLLAENIESCLKDKEILILLKNHTVEDVSKMRPEWTEGMLRALWAGYETVKNKSYFERAHLHAGCCYVTNFYQVQGDPIFGFYGRDLNAKPCRQVAHVGDTYDSLNKWSDKLGYDCFNAPFTDGKQRIRVCSGAYGDAFV